MDFALGMAGSVAPHMPSGEEVAACQWLTEDELAVYAAEYGRTGFQGGLQAYRCMFDGRENAELALFSGRTVDVPSTFIGGASDWGIHQTPGALDAMKTS